MHQLLGSGLHEAQIAVRGYQRRTFSTYMRWVCLDYIYASSGVTFTDVKVIDTPLARMASDHYPLLAEVEVKVS